MHPLLSFWLTIFLTLPIAAPPIVLGHPKETPIAQGSPAPAGNQVGSDPAVVVQFFDVFLPSQDKYPAIRIPSIVVTTKGTLLAFAEARKTLGDQSENDIVCKRSTDHGATWSALQLLHDDGVHSLNNPTSVVDQASGRIFLMYQRIPGHIKERSRETTVGLDGPNIYRNFLIWSDDDGVTWSKPSDITATTKRPDRATTIASGPGSAIQLTRGKHRGRIIFPFNEGPYHLWQNFSVFSDDVGKNWRIGVDVPGAFVPDAKVGQRSQINEVQMVELSDGAVRLDSRQFAGKKVRKTAISRDGGLTWSLVRDLPEVPDCSCMAGILRYSFDDGGGQGKIIHTGPGTMKRDHGTVYLSLDDGATFPVKRELWPGPFAYSVPIKLPDGRVGVLFEADNYKRIVLARFPIAWLTQDINYATLPQQRLEPSGKFADWPSRHREKLAAATLGADVVFIGDSITQGWETSGNLVWHKQLGSYRKLNLGFNGDSTQHVIWRIAQGELDQVGPKVVVIQIGTNNTRHGESTPQQIAQGIEAVVKLVQEKCPTATVILHPIFPSGDANDSARLRAMETNQKLATISWNERVKLMSLDHLFTATDGTLDKSLMPDLLHLSPSGYEKWAKAIHPAIESVLARP